ASVVATLSPQVSSTAARFTVHAPRASSHRASTTLRQWLFARSSTTSASGRPSGQRARSPWISRSSAARSSAPPARKASTSIFSSGRTAVQTRTTLGTVTAGSLPPVLGGHRRLLEAQRGRERTNLQLASAVAAVDQLAEDHVGGDFHAAAADRALRRRRGAHRVISCSGKGRGHARSSIGRSERPERSPPARHPTKESEKIMHCERIVFDL